MHNNANWILTNIYAPCTPLGKKSSFSGSKILTCPMM
jgi:hypothetical protein